MFNVAIRFNQPLNSWDISNVKDMFSMFEECEEFNQSLNTWDVSNVKDVSGMFDNCCLNKEYYPKNYLL